MGMKKMNNNITHLTNGDFEVMAKLTGNQIDAYTNMMATAAEIAIEQYKAGLVKWLKSQQREWQNNECSCDWGFQHTIEHIEGEK